MSEPSKLFIGIGGTVLALDPATGTILWHNKLNGLGMGFVTFEGAGQAAPAAAKRRKQKSDGGAAAAAAAG
jgi:hypothetical protein